MRYAQRDMELRHLRYFVAAAESENVSRAALKLHVSQPALSRQIRDLEEEIGFPLFKRSAKSVSLTEAGREFLTGSRAVLQRAEEAVSTARAIALDGRGEIHVGYAPSPTVRILPPTLRAFQEQLPHVRVKLHDLSTEEMLTGVREGKLQIAFIVQPSRAMLRGLRFETLACDPMCLAVPPNHAFARLRSVTVTQAANEPLVAYGRKDYPEYHEYLAALFASVKVKPRIVEEHDSAASLMAAIEAGSGVAVVPQTMACSAGPRLVLIPLKPAPEPVVIGAIWSQAGLTTVGEQFLKAARAAVLKKE
jgi:LysR family transcriptional regulator, benzoate and cis,cis-muconate-responsive activator of ben and cat genes